MEQGSDKLSDLSNLRQPSLRGAEYKKWLPSRGNFVFMLLVVFGLVWAQTKGVFARATSAPNSGYTRPIPYQGRLADASGTPLTNTYPMIFRLYAASTGGVPLWEENWSGPNSVRVSDGLFSVMLGSLTSIPETVITGNDNLWLGITVGTDDEMTPRIQLGTVPFSHQAQTVPDGSITSAKIAAGTIQRVNLAADAIPPSIPVGTVISWWRADASTPLPSGEWAFADGSVVNDPASPLNGKTLPDLRDRFIMGVSSDSIGQTGGTNTLNLAHSHTVNAHTHDVPYHTHTIAHDHNTTDRYAVAGGSLSVNVDILAPTVSNSGGWGGATSASSPGTDTQLTAPVDNRPAYVGMVYLVKIK